MSFWTQENIRRITGGRWIERPSDLMAARPLKGVSIDSRAVAPGQIFCALKGEHFDGHDFLKQACQAGAALLLVERAEPAAQIAGSGAGVLLVADALKALTQLATAYRRTLPCRVIAITGSAGKTTTKHLVHELLKGHFPGKASPKSFNNHIGVPLTILSAEPSDAYLVVEVGTNAPGEISALGRIVEPDVAIITHIGLAHLMGLGTPQGILKEKASLLSHVRTGGLAILNGDHPGLLPYRTLVPNVITFGRGKDCDLRLSECRQQGPLLHFRVNNRQAFELHMLGEHNAMNALAAIAAARSMKLSDEQIAQAMKKINPPPMRLDTQAIARPDGSAFTLINDAYNANPDSMAAALEVLKQLPTRARGRRVAILGDMAELGEASPALHRELGQRVVDSEIDLAVFIGHLSMYAAETALRHWTEKRVHAIERLSDSAAAQVASLIGDGDVVLIKASRSQGFEKLVDPLSRPGAPAAGSSARTEN